jgi:hypothetical protein
MRACESGRRGLWRKAGLAALTFFVLKGLCWVAIGYAAWRR